MLPILFALGALAGVSVGPGEMVPVAGAHRPLSCEDCHSADPGSPVHCLNCHEASENLHPTDVVPTFPMPEAFPLVEGKVVCSTCHRLHGASGTAALRRPEARDSGDLRSFCAACHGEGLGQRSPHRAEAGPNRCAFCHASVAPDAVLQGRRPAARAGLDRLCDFCHDVRSRDHPRNIDPAQDLPDSLPRGPDGEVTCNTCHNPHGSSQFTHYIREEYANNLERGRQENPHRDERGSCKGCHVERAPERITAVDHDLRYEGDTILLCISCHVTARSHHPVGTSLPEVMASRLADAGGLPLDREGRTTCATCHTNNCRSGGFKMSVQHYDPVRMSLDLCWMCHPKEEFARVDPHRKSVEDETDGCVYCHDRPPIKGLERAADLYFVSQVKMICLRCHETLSDQDVSHMGKTPTPDILLRLQGYAHANDTEFPLDREGRFTCTTCHNAHFSAKEGKHRTRLPSRQMCALCHER